MPPIVIVGAGECGTRAAFALRQHGAVVDPAALSDPAVALKPLLRAPTGA